jgi:hypothetical protein
MQHGVVTRQQLLALGMTAGLIRSRLENGHLHRVWPGVYAVGRPDLGRFGRYKAATLVCGPEAQLSHRSAADLYGIRAQSGGLIDVAVPSSRSHPKRWIRLHRRANLGKPRFIRGIPVVDPVSVLIDLAAELTVEEVEEAVNEADRLDLVPAHRLRGLLDGVPSRPGVGRLKRILDSQTFSRSQTVLERRFLALVRGAGLPLPASQKRLGKYRVDFVYPRPQPRRRGRLPPPSPHRRRAEHRCPPRPGPRPHRPAHRALHSPPGLPPARPRPRGPRRHARRQPA